MKTILNVTLIVMTILLAAAAVAGGYWLLVNNTSLLSGSGGEGMPPAAMTNAGDQLAGQPPARPEGGERGGASIGMGLLQVFVTLAKLAGVGAVVFLVEKAINRVSKKRAASLA